MKSPQEYGYLVLSLAGVSFFAVAMSFVPWQVQPARAPEPLLPGRPPENRIGDYYIGDEAFAVELPRSFYQPEPFYVHISRGDYTHPRLLRVAEALMPPRDAVLRSIPENGVRNLGYPQGAELWSWHQGGVNMPVPFALTSSTISHYLQLSEGFDRGDFSGHAGRRMLSSSLVYRAEIQHLNTYVHGAQIFENVYVARMEMRWRSMAEDLWGFWFTKHRLVVFSAGGELLAVFGDENSPAWIS